ncbi:MAG: DUF624 domain-containing protein [Tessaracoccus sp.]|uniref:YesL family protein n=1 Tax=Tessaracoccus sp. TaxID=1971211 RepID=UPI001ED5F603|nr:DUF624 domain-containing protein [Tessaracoccus sp.]MBK7822245.1 DUF624 domain-containing protein [Tessaracoccus sp.]
MRGVALGYERAARVVMMVFVVNVAFVVHVLMGVVIAGFFPAVAASYGTFRTWMLSEERGWTVKQTWVTFHRAWKIDLGAANAFGWPQLLVGLLLVWDYYLANWNDMGVAGFAVSGFLLLINVFYGLFVLASWVVRSNFDERPWWVVRTSLQMVIARPLCSAMIVALLVATVWAWSQWPGILMTFGFAVPIFAVVMAVYSFGRLPGMDARAAVGATRQYI